MGPGGRPAGAEATLKEGHAPAIAWLVPVLVVAAMVVALHRALPDGDVLGYVVGDNPLAFVVGFVCFYLVVAAILDLMVQMGERSRREAPLSEDRLFDVLFWGIRGIEIGMDPGRIADRLVERIGGRVEGKARLCVDGAVCAMRNAASTDQVLLWEDRKRDLERAEGCLRTARGPTPGSSMGGEPEECSALHEY